MAEFGQFALRSSDLDSVAQRAMHAASEIVRAPVATLWRLVAPNRLRALYIHGPLGIKAGDEYEVDARQQEQWTASAALMVGDWRQEGRFDQPLPGRAAGVLSALAVNVLAAGQPWGRLVVHDTRPRIWRQVEVDAVQSLANVLAAAIERDADGRAQSLVAAFGQFALRSSDLDSVAQRAMDLVTELVRAPIASLSQLVAPTRKQILYARGPLSMKVGEESEIDGNQQPLWSADEPLIIEDWRQEGRFERPAAGRAAGVLSSLAVNLLVRGQPWGRLVVHDTRARRWRPVQVDAVQSLANALAAVVERHDSDLALRRLNEDLERRVLARTQDLHRQTRELRAANEELDAFSYSVSHDLRAPLRAVNGFSRIVRDTYADLLPAEAIDYLDRAHDGAVRMGVLIDALLEMSHTQRAPLTLTRVDMTALARACWQDLAAEQQRGGSDRAVRLDLADLPAAAGDVRLLRQVWTNLLTNARQYVGAAPEPVVRVSAQPADNTDHDEPMIQYTVADNGAGFDMRYAAKLFQAFQRLHRAEDYPGIGIGLALVKRIVIRHGGTVSAEGDPGHGASFSFTLRGPNQPTATADSRKPPDRPE